jgi:hypothetical protein
MTDIMYSRSVNNYDNFVLTDQSYCASHSCSTVVLHDYVSSLVLNAPPQRHLHIPVCYAATTYYPWVGITSLDLTLTYYPLCIRLSLFPPLDHTLNLP